MNRTQMDLLWRKAKVLQRELDRFAAVRAYVHEMRTDITTRPGYCRVHMTVVGGHTRLAQTANIPANMLSLTPDNEIGELVLNIVRGAFSKEHMEAIGLGAIDA